MNVIKMSRVPELLGHAAACPGCSSPKFRHEDGGMYCLSCSLVIIEE